MLHPQVIANRRYGNRLTQKLTVIQYSSSLADDNNNSNKTKSPKTSHRKNQTKPTKFSGCCVAAHSIEDLSEVTKSESTKSHPERKERKGEEKKEAKNDKKTSSWAGLKVILANKKHILDKLSHKSRKSHAKVSVVEYYEDEIAGEIVIINKHHLFNTDDGEEITIVIRDYLTPPNYSHTIEYYRQINKAREVYLHAALVAGKCLLRGECEGYRAEWAEYLYQAERVKKNWRENCRKNDKLHEKNKRHRRLQLGFRYTCANYFRRIWKCVNECKSIFPCCFPP